MAVENIFAAMMFYINPISNSFLFFLHLCNTVIIIVTVLSVMGEAFPKILSSSLSQTASEPMVSPHIPHFRSKRTGT